MNKLKVLYVISAYLIFTLVSYSQVTDSIPTPILINPPNGGIVQYPINFIWHKCTGAISYRIQLSLNVMCDTGHVIKDTTLSDTIYTFNSNNPIFLYWRVRAYGSTSSSLWSNVWHFSAMTHIKRDIDFLPSHFILYDCYPNPFNPTTTIKIDIPKECEGKLIVYNELGEAMETLMDGHLKPGVYHVTVTNDKLSSGVYFYRFVSESFSDTKKMILLK